MMEYKPVYSREISYVAGVKRGIRILIAAEETVSEACQWQIVEHGNAILKVLEATAVRQDPELPLCKKELRDVFEKAFHEAGLVTIYMEEIPNEYCSEPCCFHLPWFIVTTKIGRFKLGWRKRVIHLEWTQSLLYGYSAEDLFPAEDVTKSENVIHAWSYDKLTVYLRVLAQHAPQA